MATVWSSTAYDVAVGLAAAGGTVLCVAARRATADRSPVAGCRDGWPVTVSRGLALVLVGDAAAYAVSSLVGHRFSVDRLPLQLCHVAIGVAAAACWWRVALLVEVTYF